MRQCKSVSSYIEGMVNVKVGGGSILLRGQPVRQAIQNRYE